MNFQTHSSADGYLKAVENGRIVVAPAEKFPEIGKTELAVDPDGGTEQIEQGNRRNTAYKAMITREIYAHPARRIKVHTLTYACITLISPSTARTLYRPTLAGTINVSA